MDSAWIAMAMGILMLVAGMLSVELGISVAPIEIVLGVVAANTFELHGTPWIDFLASFASIVLIFLAGAEVDPDLMRERLSESLWMAARDGKFDLLVVGFVGHSNVFGRVMGSTTQNLSRLSPCSVLIVK
jgi:nucleotide-binding universal stress UspA family protein